MTLKQKISAMPVIAIVAITIVANSTSTAFAHVTVKPAEVVTAGYQTFTVNVPNEKEIPTTSIKVVIPNSIKNATPTQKAGWQVSAEKTGEGDDTVVKSLTWSDGSIGDGLRDEFTFSAKVPGKTGELQWKAYQTYEDGTVVSWDKAEESGHGHGDGNSGPFSVTKVVAETESDTALAKATQAAADANTTAQRSLYIGFAGVLVGLIAIYLSTRKK